MSSLAHIEDASSLAPQLDTETRATAAHGLDPALFERSLLAGAREFLARPGKAFRGRLVEACFALAGGARGGLPRAAIEAIELLHAGSLIVDDIQDEASVRRGAPALHRVIGTPRALNTGNWLYFVALSRLSALGLSAEREAALLRAAHQCLVRCHEGQALDLGLQVGGVKGAELAAISGTLSRLKTGALMGFAARLGGEVAGASQASLACLERFGERLGVGLQMLDDLGSFVSDDRRGKALEDLAGERINWVWTWTREGVDEVSFRKLLRDLGRRDDHAELSVRLGVASERIGRARIREELRGALSELRRGFGDSPALSTLEHEIVRLEKSYG